MDKERTNKWLAVGIFLPTTLIFAFFIYYLATFLLNPPVPQSERAEGKFTVATPMPSGKVVLTKGQLVALGNVHLVYQGLDSDAIVLDVTLLAMDPDYAYRRRITKQMAKQGFHVDQQRFKLVSANGSRLKIIRCQG